MITKPSEWLEEDSRFKHWGKLVSKSDINLKQDNGYSLGGEFVKWNDSVAFSAGKWLVCASETGSMKYHSYKYCLIDGATGEQVYKQDRIGALDKALEEGHITEEQRANAKNSILYGFALYISLQDSAESPEQIGNPLASFTDDQIRAEFTRRGLSL